MWTPKREVWTPRQQYRKLESKVLDHMIERIVERERASESPAGPFALSNMLMQAPEHVRANLAKAKMFPGMVGTRQGFQGADIMDWAPTAYASINTTTTETPIFGAIAAGLLTQCAQMAPNDAKQGKGYQIEFGATLSSAASSPGTINFSTRWGASDTLANNTLIAAGTAVTLTASLSSVPVYGLWTGGMRAATANGATGGVCNGTGIVTWGTGTIQQILWNGSVGVDTTGTATSGIGLFVTMTFGTSSASNAFICQWYIPVSLN